MFTKQLIFIFEPTKLKAMKESTILIIALAVLIIFMCFLERKEPTNLEATSDYEYTVVAKVVDTIAVVNGDTIYEIEYIKP